MAQLGDRIARLRRIGRLTQEQLAERAGVSVDVVKKLEQGRKHSARLPTLHALAHGLGVELTSLLGEPPAVSVEQPDPPQLVTLRRAIAPPFFGRPPEPSEAGLSADALRASIAQTWTLYHAATFDDVLARLPGLINNARFAAAAGNDRQRAAGHGLLAKSLQLGGHLAIRLSRTDLALAALERAMTAAELSSAPLLPGMISTSVAWSYQRQARLDDAWNLAVHAADQVEHEHAGTTDGVRVWGGLLMSAATSAARAGDYERANEMMTAAEAAAGRLAALPPSADGRLVSVFSRSSVRIERVRLAVQHARPDEALALAKGMRLSADVPPSWRTWLLLDVARAHADLGDAPSAVRVLERLDRVAPTWIRHHTLAVSLVRDLSAVPHPPAGLRRLADLLGVT
ncbi:helix-turn-helix domain-containing protein [Streptomyces sp. 3MP-14]|uniref:Helix-turn-helix domain-containing protein n=1 Tax=Streptomyces mimosae TaxID=2586635 RepID=A0A5N5ZY04_9ACTN|nr:MULTISPECIES: helix-turn-helix domain-containing protein [Streptomyces]KAB8161401.1 helix-turn-helix domain-containing protein [Streptomyces mimosae]KAB8173275.1 helix-turn-helix domain-containing protein [Streptomyces sp. 3MP-14]